VIDFGIAKLTGEEPAADGLTRLGEIVGTPEYMSPEQTGSGGAVVRHDHAQRFGLLGRVVKAGDSGGKLVGGCGMGWKGRHGEQMNRTGQKWVDEGVADR
jgi:serine/threonine protein kinase